MRQSIRDFLLVMSVLVGGLAISLTAVVADDEQLTPAGAVAEQPAAPTVDTPVAGTSDKIAGLPAKSTDPPVEDPAKEASEGAAREHDDNVKADGGGDHVGEETHVGEEPHGASGGKHDEHHDPHDLGHQNATPALEDPSEIKSDLAIWTLLVFLCLLALLGKFAWGPIMEGLERREASIATAIDDAEKAAAKGAEQLKLYEAKLAAAGDETREILARARKDAEATGEPIVAEAQEAAARERDKAVADISAAKNSALQEITERSVDLAVSMAGRMIQRQLTPDDRAGLIREALDQIPNQN